MPDEARGKTSLAAKVIRRLRPPSQPDEEPDDPEGGIDPYMGRHQFEFLVARGLRPDHDLLDVGCGTLRGGLHYIRYLDPGRYVGFDIIESKISWNIEELERQGLAAKNATVLHIEDFDVTSLGRRFDFAIAQSVFSHLPLNPIVRCLVCVRRVLEPDGVFYATFFEAPRGEPALEPIFHPDRPPSPRPVDSYFDRDPFHYDVDTFHWAAGRADLRCQYIGDWNHPRGQHMLAFRHADVEEMP